MHIISSYKGPIFKWVISGRPYSFVSKEPEPYAWLTKKQAVLYAIKDMVRHPPRVTHVTAKLSFSYRMEGNELLMEGRLFFPETNETRKFIQRRYMFALWEFDPEYRKNEEYYEHHLFI